MMKTKNSLPLFILLLISVFFFSSCHKDNKPCPWDHTTDIYQNLSDTDKALIPSRYKGYDTITFISSAGDTANLYGQGRKSYKDVTTSGPFMADCGIPQDALHSEVLELNFKGNNSELYTIGYRIYINIDHSADLTVNNKTYSFDVRYLFSPSNYTDIVKVNGINYNCLDSKEQPLIYYNPQLGILRIDSVNGKTWTLNK